MDSHFRSPRPYSALPRRVCASDKEQAEAARELAEEEWRDKTAERDGQIERLEKRLLEAERAQGEAEEKLEQVTLTLSLTLGTLAGLAKTCPRALHRYSCGCC